MRNFVILVLSVSMLSTFAIAADESYESVSHPMRAVLSCMEGFNSCRDFLSNSRCLSRSILKRPIRADASGPFWANRGKREPTFISSRLFAEEPTWKLVRRDEDSTYDPFFTTRGKKLQERTRDRRTEDKLFPDGAVSPFLAARGKKDNADLTY